MVIGFQNSDPPFICCILDAAFRKEKGDGFIFQIASQTALCASSSLWHFALIIMIAELGSCLSMAPSRWQFWSKQPYVANK